MRAVDLSKVDAVIEQLEEDGYKNNVRIVRQLREEYINSIAIALAAVQLMDEETSLGNLSELRDRAKEVFNGEDKKTIEALREELRHTREAMQRMQRPPDHPGIASVFGRKRVDGQNVDLALQIFQITPDYEKGVYIGVYLP